MEQIITKFDAICAYLKQEEKLFAKRFWKENRTKYAAGNFQQKRELNQKFYRELEAKKDQAVLDLNLFNE